MNRRNQRLVIVSVFLVLLALIMNFNVSCSTAQSRMSVFAAAGAKPALDEIGQIFKEKYGLPDYIEPDLHIILGYPAIGVIKPSRIPLKDMMIEKPRN